MSRVLLLATTTGYQTRAFGEAAERLGVDLVFATDRCTVLEDPWQDRALPIRFYDEDASVAAILEASRTTPIDGVLAVGDRPTVIAARVSQALGLPGHPPEAAAASRNKQLTRQRLKDAGLPSPWFLTAPISADPEGLSASVSYPCVIKPIALSGSRGVMRVDDDAGFRAGFERLRALLRSPDIRAERSDAHELALIEGYIEGREFALEGLLDHGALHVLAIFDKPDPLDGPFFEETIYLTPSAAPPDVQAAIVDGVGRAARAIGLRHGPVHAECRVNDAGAFVLEVAARPIGGLCARALRFLKKGDGSRFQTLGMTQSGGFQAGKAADVPGENDSPPLFPLEEVLLRQALGEPARGWQREPLASGVMMIPIPRRGVFRGVEGIDHARRVTYVDDVRIPAKAEQVLVPLPEGASYLGFIFARAQTLDAVEGALRAAHARLEFSIDPEVRVLQSTHD